MSPASRPSPSDLARFAEAVAALAVAGAAIRFLPFRLVIQLMGGADPAPTLPAFAESVRIAIRRASRRVPWKTLCFQEGLAAHWMLRRRGQPSRLHYGIRNADDRMTAHVWVTLRGEIVVGEEHPATRHLPVAVYPLQAGAGRPTDRPI